MDSDPYRIAPPRPPEAPIVRDLGALRAKHGPVPLGRALLHPILASVLTLVGGIVATRSSGPIGMQIVVVFAVLIFLGFSLDIWRKRDRRVDSHANGVVVFQGSRRDPVAFEDVNEVWMDLAVSEGALKRSAQIRGLFLVDNAGVTHRVPAALERGDELVQWILKSCSTVLLPAARAQLREGSALTFGDYKITQEGLSEGSDFILWKDLTLVRLQAGRIVLFRKQTLVPWKTIYIHKVPHPTVLLALVQELAVKIEVDD